MRIARGAAEFKLQCRRKLRRGFELRQQTFNVQVAFGVRMDVPDISWSFGELKSTVVPMEDFSSQIARPEKKLREVPYGV